MVDQTGFSRDSEPKLFRVCDILAFQSYNYTTMPFSERYKICGAVVDGMCRYERGSPDDSFNWDTLLQMKVFCRLGSIKQELDPMISGMYSTDLFQQRYFIQEGAEHPIDGLIFMHSKSPYKVGICKHVLKWKPNPTFEATITHRNHTTNEVLLGISFPFYPSSPNNSIFEYAVFDTCLLHKSLHPQTKLKVEAHFEQAFKTTDNYAKFHGFNQELAPIHPKASSSGAIFALCTFEPNTGNWVALQLQTLLRSGTTHSTETTVVDSKEKILNESCYLPTISTPHAVVDVLCAMWRRKNELLPTTRLARSTDQKQTLWFRVCGTTSHGLTLAYAVPKICCIDEPKPQSYTQSPKNGSTNKSYKNKSSLGTLSIMQVPLNTNSLKLLNTFKDVSKKTVFEWGFDTKTLQITLVKPRDKKVPNFHSTFIHVLKSVVSNITYTNLHSQLAKPIPPETTRSSEKMQKLNRNSKRQKL